MMGSLLAAVLFTGTLAAPESTPIPLEQASVTGAVSSPLCDMGHGEWLGGTLQIDEPTEELNANEDRAESEQEGRVPCWFV